MVEKKWIYLLPLAMKDSYFMFNNILHKQIDGVTVGSPLGLHQLMHLWLNINKIG